MFDKPDGQPAVKRPQSILLGRPVWVYFVGGTYLLALLTLLTFPAWSWWAMSALAGGNVPLTPLGLTLLVLAGVIVVILVGVSLFVIPVGEVSRRPVGQTPIVVTILGSSVSAALLVFGGALALHALVFPDGATRDGAGRASDFAAWMVLAAPLLAWLIWAVLFSWLASSVDPLSLADRTYKWLLGGSVLELLVAVSSHVVVRRRGDCCGGFLTGVGIILGTAIMIVALGPGVFFLFYRRYQQTYRRPPLARTQEDEDNE
jgi:hypothetical protein